MNKSEQFLATQELVEHLWEGYKVKRDPRWLAEICLNVPFFDHPEIGQEIAKRLQASFHDVNQIDEQTMRNDIWKLWQTYKGSDTDVAVRARIAEIFFKGQQGASERVRGIIRSFEKLEK